MFKPPWKRINVKVKAVKIGITGRRFSCEKSLSMGPNTKPTSIKNNVSGKLVFLKIILARKPTTTIVTATVKTVITSAHVISFTY